MKKIIFPISLMSLALHHSAYAIDVTANPFGSVNAIISSSEPNVIHVKNDSIKSLSAKAGAIIQDEASNDGSVVFSTLEKNPFSIVIETEKGFTFTLKANPKEKSESVSVVIHNLAEKGEISDEVIESLSRYQSYSGLITAILTDFINGKVPDGFVDSWRTKYKAGNLDGLKVRNIQSWVGQNMRVVKLDLTNISTDEIELNERYLWSQGVMAVAYYPKASVLRPNTRVFAYVIMKEVD
ncbi:TraK domain-containing protein [Ursidibacter arcticus]